MNSADRFQLQSEIDQVKRALELAEKPGMLDGSQDLVLEFAKTQKTMAVSPVELFEYINYLYDFERHSKDNDKVASESSLFNVADRTI